MKAPENIKLDPCTFSDIGLFDIDEEEVSYVRKDALWKPTPDQLKALNAINCFGELSYQGQQQHLIELYKQLKQLCNEQ